MDKQVLIDQVMEQLSKDKDILAFAAEMNVSTPQNNIEEQPAFVQLLQKAVQTTLDAVLESKEETDEAAFIAQSFNRFDEVYKALS